MQPPNNPYSNPSDFNNPVPSSPMPGAMPPRTPEISFDAIGQAWKLLQPNLGTYVGAFLIYIVISAIFSGMQGAITPKDARGIPQIGPTYFLINLVSFVVGQFLLGGLWRMALSTVRTGRAELGQMFSAGDVFFNVLVASIVIAVATVLGFVFCIVPGLLLSGLFMFAIPLIVDKRQSAFEAIGNSFNALKSQMWMALLFFFVVGLVASVGALACGVGILVTAPLALLSIALTYNNFFGTGQSSVLPSMPPIAPIADPFR